MQTATSQHEHVLSERDAARWLGVSATTLRRDRATGLAGGIPFIKIGARIVYRAEALERWLAEREQQPAARPQPTPRARRRGRPTKTEQVEAARLGLTIAQLRAQKGVAA